MYYNGRWNNWVKSNTTENELYNEYLYYLGTDYTNITGGWSGYAYRPSTSTASPLSAPSIEMGTSYMTITENSTDVGAAITGYSINLTEYSYIEIEYESSIRHSAATVNLFCTSKKTNDYVASASVDITSTNKTVATLDISDLNGNYYLGIVFFCSSINIYSIKLVK